MVSVMVAALSPDQRDSHTRVHHRPPLGIPEEADSERGIVSYGMPARVNVQALTCSLWCAVALGALVRGWPTSSVRSGIHSVCGLLDVGGVSTATTPALLHVTLYARLYVTSA